MKTWQAVLLGFFLGIIASGILLIVVSPPLGSPINLLPPPTPQPLVVHITGCVAAQGVYQLPQGSRIINAIEAAGGACKDADLSGINLASKVIDGTQIHLLTQQEALLASDRHSDIDKLLLDNSLGEKMDINTATLEMIETLPGIGPGKARDIIAFRQEFGAIQSLSDLLKVPGIGEATINQIKPYLTQQ